MHLRVLAEMPCYATTMPLCETPPAERHVYGQTDATAAAALSERVL